MAATIPMRRDKTREANNRLPRQTAAHRCIKTTKVADTYLHYIHTPAYVPSYQECVREEETRIHAHVNHTHVAHRGKQGRRRPFTAA